MDDHMTLLHDHFLFQGAEELLHGELSVALGIPFHEVPAYIESVIGKPGKRTKKAAHAAEASSAEEKE